MALLSLSAMGGWNQHSVVTALLFFCMLVSCECWVYLYRDRRMKDPYFASGRVGWGARAGLHHCSFSRLRTAQSLTLFVFSTKEFVTRD